jgi:glutamate racemase
MERNLSGSPDKKEKRTSM